MSLDSPGSGNAPSFKGLKKLGADSPSEIPEPEVLDEDYQEVPDSVPIADTPPKVPLKLKTKSGLDDAHEPVAPNLDDFLNQESDSEKVPRRFFFSGLVEFTPKTRKIFLGLTIGLCLLGLVVSFNTVLLNLVLALASYQLVRVFSMQKKTLEKFGLFPARVAMTLILSLVFMMLPLSYRWWQTQGSAYLESLQNVENLANDGQQKIKSAVQDVEEHVGEHIEASAIATHEFEYSAKITQTFHDKTYLSGGGLLQMYFQYVFFLSACLLAPFCRERNWGEVTPLSDENDGVTWKFARYFMLRLVKAAVISLIFAIGLKYIAYENLFFIVGCTFILSVISRFGLLVGLLLCIPVAVMEFSVGENGLNSLITLAVTGIVALLVEKKLHWLMIILPMRKDGIIPPSMLQAPQERTDSEGRGFSSIMKLLNVALTLALYGGVAFAGYRCYSIYTDQVDARLEVNAALESLPDAKDTAFVILEDYREKYPADREVLLSMSKAYLGVAEVDNALALADAFRDFKEPTVEDLNYIQTAEFYVRGALTTSKRRINKNEAHRSLVLDYRELYSDFLGKKEYLKIGEALLKANENSQEAYRAIALYHKSNKGFKECREWCTKGLEKDKGDVRLFCLVAESYYLEGDKMAALKALIEVDAITTDDEEAIKLRAMVLKL